MKNKELFDKTIGILVNAYMNDTLEHTNCYACAVQNMVAGNMGLQIIPKPKGHILYSCPTVNLVIKGMAYEKTLVASLCEINLEEAGLTNSQIQQMQSTGYNYNELTEIERAFEGVSEIDCATSDEYMYKGLIAVCDTLMQIHEATEAEITEAKQLFVKC